MEYKDIYDCGNKLNKLAFNRTFSLATGSKEDYYNRFVRKTDYLELRLLLSWAVSPESSISEPHYYKSFLRYIHSI